MNPLRNIFDPLDKGNHIIIHQGRDLKDFTVDEHGRILPIVEAIRAEAMCRNMVLIQYSKSSGISYDATSLTKSESQDVDKVLNGFGIAKNAPGSHDSNEFASIMRGLLKLVQATEYPSFRDGKKMAFMIVIEFSEHQCPSMQPGFLSEEQMISIELAAKLSTSLGLRKSGCYIIFSEERDGTLNDILKKHINVVRLPQPDTDEKKDFLAALKTRYTEVEYEDNLSDEVIINISANSPNRGIENIFLSATRTHEPITTAILSAKKQEDIVNLSEGTLEAVDFDRVRGQKLMGKNIERPLNILSKATEALRKGENSAFRNLILAGAPSTGKTHLATVAALDAGIQAFTLNSPKSGIVGESERKTKLMLSLLREQKGVGIIDELEMVLPMDRSTGSNDGGVTQNLMGQLQSFLSDGSLAGKVSMIATSNKPGAISSAMLSRWIVVPVLMPLKEDYPAIIQSIITSIDKSSNIDIEAIMRISDAFYYAGATAREIRESLIGALAFIDGPLSERHLEFAGMDIISSSNRYSYIHSDLMAIKFCRSNSFFPWWDIDQNRPDKSYPFPDYILEIMTDDHRVDQNKLNKRIDELAPYSNV